MPRGSSTITLGTVLAKEGQLPASRYHLEQALHKGFVDSRVVGNLRTVKYLLMAKDLENSEAWSDRTLNFALDIPQPLFLTLSLLLALGILLIVRLKKLALKRTIIGILFALSFIPFLFSQFYLKTVNYAINLEETVLHEGPSEIYPEIMALDAGSKFIIKDENNGWFFIESPDFLSGWIHRDKLAIY